MDLDYLRRVVREELADTTALERARALHAICLEVYDHVKFCSPEGGGLDGAAGPERTSLARLVDAATGYLDQLRAEGLHWPDPPAGAESAESS